MRNINVCVLDQMCEISKTERELLRQGHWISVGLVKSALWALVVSLHCL